MFKIKVQYLQLEELSYKLRANNEFEFNSNDKPEIQDINETAEGGGGGTDYA